MGDSCVALIFMMIGFLMINIKVDIINRRLNAKVQTIEKRLNAIDFLRTQRQESTSAETVSDASKNVAVALVYLGQTWQQDQEHVDAIWEFLYSNGLRPWAVFQGNIESEMRQLRSSLDEFGMLLFRVGLAAKPMADTYPYCGVSLGTGLGSLIGSFSFRGEQDARILFPPRVIFFVYSVDLQGDFLLHERNQL